MKNRALIVVNSTYQLLTAVNIKYKLLKERETDILLTDVTIQLKDYIGNLKETGVFSKVIYGKTFEMNQKYSSGNVPEISECFQKIDSLFRWNLSEKLEKYTEVYFANYDVFVRMLACKFYEECEFIAYEDGFSSYIIDYLDLGRAKINEHLEAIKIKKMVKKVLLYEPRLAVRKGGLQNIQLPKISRDDKELIQILNYIFSYQKMNSQYKFIFLEQSFRADGIKGNDIELMEECRKCVERKEFIVKTHPRNRINIPFERGLSCKDIDNAPWELFLLNEDLEDKTVITICSNAALTSRIVLGIEINTVMLYELYNGKVLWKEDLILKKYLDKFRKEFAMEKYYVPRTIYELRNTIKFLGEQV